MNGVILRRSWKTKQRQPIVTDCRSMYDILTRTAIPSCSGHRTTIKCLLIRERLQSNCDVRWVTSQAMLADCLTKSMDARVLRQCLASGKYSLFDEEEIPKKRADSRQRLLWVKNQERETPQPAVSSARTDRNLKISGSLGQRTL